MWPPDLLNRAESLEAWHLSLYTREAGETASFGPITAFYAGESAPINFGLWTGRAPGELPRGAEAFFHERGLAPRITAFSHVHPEVLKALADASYRLSFLLHLHARDLAASVPAPDLPCRVASPDEWLEVVVKGFGEESRAIMRLTSRRPETTLWLCDVDGVPACAGALSVRGEDAVLFSTATRPEWRGRGAQTALLRARLRAAADLGATHAFIMTSPGSDSERNAGRAGFSPLATRLSFQRSE